MLKIGLQSPLLFATYPYIFLLNMLFPIKMIGFNFYFVITSVVFFALFIRALLGRYESTIPVVKQLLFFALLTFFFFFSLHLISNNIPLTAKLLMSYRIGITPIFYLFIAFVILKIAGVHKISKIIIINAFIQSIIGIERRRGDFGQGFLNLCEACNHTINDNFF